MADQPFPTISWTGPARTHLVTLTDRGDLLFHLALLSLPVDGTRLGVYAPFWTPIAPWLFLAYALLNWRELPNVYRHFRVWFLFPAALIVLSGLGWATVGFPPVAAVESWTAVVGALATLVAVDIAIRVKRLPWGEAIRTIIVAYWFAFAVGVIQWIGIVLDLGSLRSYFDQLMTRSYVISDSPWGGGRPQFLFAEPSYIGMHLFGVLLPLMWLMRGRDRIYAKRLRDLIVVFAAGSVLMGAGVRIILDSLVALIIVIVERVRWRDPAARRRGSIGLVVSVAVGVACVALNGRLNSIASNGMEGDGSFYARFWQSLGPLSGLVRHPIYLLTGYGAGNIADATHAGSDLAAGLLTSLRLDTAAPSEWYARMTPDTIWTMSAYTSFLAEYGVVGLALAIWLIARHLTDRRAWNKTTICWFALVVYLYIQFEGYAFAAIPLLVWAVSMQYGLNPAHAAGMGAGSAAVSTTASAKR
ncbi:hypothetical protein [Bifidobacterium avesanii]|uniref:O-antigen ligase domain-containing protein n=1 Tax=Bifidobacterium avesanii TaxID=1798157 RepID=A0A7K3TFL3_9BIFI|nr:hypothetical protein [Bifidobacterium avesanii]KAB8294334.1 hypothetical protein DSM100685_0462 [Bifidobacterium avesanii]NEG77832.1 hypothetical protein [Bifidobacterium avesanii]